MEIYKNLSGRSDVGRYEIGQDCITVEFKAMSKSGFTTYKYTYASAGSYNRKYLKGGKKEVRKTKDGFSYSYSEGPMVFPDSLAQPSRTIVTGEGGPTPSRFKHVIKTKSGRLRRLTPVELERLCMFPDDHTKGQNDVRRAFFMGNALVVGVINRLGHALLENI